MNELEILRAISQLSGKNEKRDLLQNNKTNDKLGQLLNAALNFYRKFYIHKWTMPVPSDIEKDQHEHFMILLSILETRQVTGNDAKAKVEVFFTECSAFQQEWYAKVLRKDLKIGVSDETAAKFFDIPTFDVQLATDGKKCKKIDKIISDGVYASPKFDGYRCIAIIDNGEVTLYSRNGTIFTNFPSIEASLKMSFPMGNRILDGEIMSDDFQSMQKSAFASKRGTTVGDVKYFVFDHIALDEWKSGVFKETKEERLIQLSSAALYFQCDHVEAVSQEFTQSLDRVKELEVQYMSMGFEGVMILPNIPYYRGRNSNSLMKFKTMLSQDCKIVDFYEGKIGTKHEGRMGGIVLNQENNISCDCGSGFSDSDRDYMWNNKDEFLGRTIEVKYQELTPDGVMRFPVFIRFRDDK